MAGENENEVVQPDDGFDDTERAQFEAMRTGAEQPADAGGADGAGEAADGAQPGAGEAERAAAAAGQESGASDDDGDDDADAATQAGQQPGQETRTPKRVRYEKYKRAADEADTLKKQLAERDEKMARLSERMTIINEALAPKQQAKKPGDDDPEPELDEHGNPVDIFAYSAWQRRELKRTQDAVNEIRAGREQETAAAAMQRDFESDAFTYARTEPHFPAAYQWLMGNRVAELAVYFFGKDVTADGATLTRDELTEIQRTIASEERELVSSAQRAGKSAAERIYALARARGFRPPAPQNGNGAAHEGANGKGNGQNGAEKAAPGNLAAEAAKVESGQGAKPNGNGQQNGKGSVAEEIARVRQGSESGLSLSQGGGAPALALTPERLADMPQDEFDALMDQLTPAEARRAMGG